MSHCPIFITSANIATTLQYSTITVRQPALSPSPLRLAPPSRAHSFHLWNLSWHRTVLAGSSKGYALEDQTGPSHFWHLPPERPESQSQAQSQSIEIFFKLTIIPVRSQNDTKKLKTQEIDRRERQSWGISGNGFNGGKARARQFQCKDRDHDRIKTQDIKMNHIKFKVIVKLIDDHLGIELNKNWWLMSMCLCLCQQVSLLITWLMLRLRLWQIQHPPATRPCPLSTVRCLSLECLGPLTVVNEDHSLRALKTSLAQTSPLAFLMSSNDDKNGSASTIEINESEVMLSVASYDHNFQVISNLTFIVNCGDAFSSSQFKTILVASTSFNASSKRPSALRREVHSEMSSLTLPVSDPPSSSEAARVPVAILFFSIVTWAAERLSDWVWYFCNKARWQVTRYSIVLQ